MWLGGLVFIAHMAGCSQPEGIREYDVPKPPHRMLGAIIVKGEEGWFFKVTGPREGLAAETEKFRKFVESVRFEEGASGPKWTLPDGWQEAGASKMRYMTIKLKAGGEDCELSVSRLPMRGNSTSYVLDNLNRWRGQIQSYPLISSELPTATTAVPLAGDLQATLMDVVGTLEPKSPQSKGGMEMGDMDSMMAGPPPSAPRSPPANLKFKLPEGWKEGEGSAFSKLAFEVRSEGQQVKITVTDLPAAANPLLDNINRWRGQMRLPPVTEADLPNHLRAIPVDGGSGQYVQIEGAKDAPKPQTLLGVVAYRGESAWFVKLQGDAPLAAREKERFEQFVQSLKF